MVNICHVIRRFAYEIRFEIRHNDGQMARKQKPSRQVVPGALQHPPAPLRQERDTPYVVGAALSLVGLLGAGLLFHPQPSVLGIGPEPNIDQPLVAEAATTPDPTPITTPVAQSGSAAATAPASTSVAAASAANTVSSGGNPTAPTGGGGVAVPVPPPAAKPVLGIKPVDTVINLVKNRAVVPKLRKK